MGPERRARLRSADETAFEVRDRLGECGADASAAPDRTTSSRAAGRPVPRSARFLGPEATRSRRHRVVAWSSGIVGSSSRCLVAPVHTAAVGRRAAGHLVRAVTLWLDCGNGTLAALAASPTPPTSPRSSSRTCIRITASISTGCTCSTSTASSGLASVYAPEGVRARASRHLVSSWSDTFDWREVGDGDAAPIGPVDLRFLRTDHPRHTAAGRARPRRSPPRLHIGYGTKVERRGFRLRRPRPLGGDVSARRHPRAAARLRPASGRWPRRGPSTRAHAPLARLDPNVGRSPRRPTPSAPPVILAAPSLTVTTDRSLGSPLWLGMGDGSVACSLAAPLSACRRVDHPRKLPQPDQLPAKDARCRPVSGREPDELRPDHVHATTPRWPPGRCSSSSGARACCAPRRSRTASRRGCAARARAG